MPKPNYSFQKRQRELAKKQKKEAKKAQKAAERAPKDEPGLGAAEGVERDANDPGSARDPSDPTAG